jgi:hypothetical protein
MERGFELRKILSKSKEYHEILYQVGVCRYHFINALIGIEKPMRRKLVIGSRCGFRKPVRKRHLNVYCVLLGLIFRGKSET